MNKVSKILESNQYEEVVKTIRNGFVNKDCSITKSNNRIATALVLSANTGMPMSYIVKLRLEDFVEDEYGYLIKVGSKNFAASKKLYQFLKEYANENNLNIQNKLFDLSTRAIQQHLSKTCEYLEYEDVITTESFKKMFTDRIYGIGCKPNIYKKFTTMINE